MECLLRRGLTLVALAGLSCSVATARAQASWSQAGVTLVRLYSTSGGFTPQQRVEEMDARMTEILSGIDGPLTPRDIRIARQNGDYCITVRDILLVTTTPADAAANHTRAYTLARCWLASMRKVLPQIAPRVNKKGI